MNIQTTGLRRLIGLLQITGLNMPGVSLEGALVRSITEYSSSYVMLATGFLALVWCMTRDNTQSGKIPHRLARIELRLRCFTSWLSEP